MATPNGNLKVLRFELFEFGRISREPLGSGPC
jgi:hypothetical protein